MTTRKPVVLLAPLDWGLGHTVRCIPIIQELLKRQCEVLVACNSKQKLLLAQEFPTVSFFDLPGYDIYYGGKKLSTLFNLFIQVPKILTRINQEKNWLRKILPQTSVDALISDNRYGFFSDAIPCIFMTHQLRVKSGMGAIIDNLIQKCLYSFINKFTACWVPDWKDPVANAGGELSHPKQFPRIPVTYIGCLSRLEKCRPLSKTIEILVILSGPEPQRTRLEKIILLQLKGFRGRGVFIRGVFDNSTLSSFNDISILNQVSSAELNRLICHAQIVICRAGYTSIMDILKLGKKSILIPTPGQAEQEYLAIHLHRKKLAIIGAQQSFHLESAMKTTNDAAIRSIDQSMDQYKKVVSEFVDSLKKNISGYSIPVDLGKSKK